MAETNTAPKQEAKTTETPVKTLPSNNKETQPAQGPMPESFTISKAGVDDLVNALNEVIASKYVKQVLFNVINENFKPVFADQDKK